MTKVWDVQATTNAIMALADELAEAGIERVVVESTSDYWRAFVYLFQARGITTWLVNARDVKQVPGRPKTDKIDAVWLAKLNERGMLRASFVPPVEIRQLRDYTRLRPDLTEKRSRHKQRRGPRRRGVAIPSAGTRRAARGPSVMVRTQTRSELR